MHTNEPAPPPSIFEENHKRKLTASERKRIADEMLAEQVDLKGETETIMPQKKTQKKPSKAAHKHARKIGAAALGTLALSAVMFVSTHSMTLERFCDHLLAGITDALWLLAFKVDDE